MRSLRPLAASGSSNLSDNSTLLPGEMDDPSSSLSRTSSGQQLEPDDNKLLTYAGYSSYRRVCWVLVRRYERGYTGESGRRGYRKWCSGGTQDMV